MQTLIFSPVTPDQFAKVIAALQAKDLQVAGTEGEIKKFGADVRFAYCAPVLTLTVVSAPHFYSMGGFCREIHEAVEAML
ncbi:MAG TPA: hypothetical protein VM554_15115 [Acidisarcina sp.]|nr:hypothetical protein [Acidisarcina sp.]